MRRDDPAPADAREYLSLTLEGFLGSVASAEPAPGGGSAAAVTAALAAALAGMSARLSGERLPDAGDLADRAESLRGRASALVREDAEAYGRVLAALRLPKSEPGRREAVDRAFSGAADAPLGVAEIAREAAEVAARLAGEGNPSLRGDALTAVYLAEAAARSAAELVRLNVEELGAADEKDRIARAHGLYRETAELARSASGGGRKPTGAVARHGTAVERIARERKGR